MPFWLIAALFVGALVLVSVIRPKVSQPGQKPAGIGDFQAPTAQEREIPVLFGTRECKGPNVLWYGDLSTKAIHAKGGGKKG